ncbi:hypothetical protein J437_LFUL012005 [Ladona fulva]|uniref:Uncharacterized protein n=1 Tax=Ladona fulva TaxID=123851 RepID=A0A8K0P5X2_LADFU|nr:hypothetical protein J437_LFUL012005 [Ladona fulva]
MSDDSPVALILDKIKFYASKPNENVDNLRQVVSKLSSRASCQALCIQCLVFNDAEALHCIFGALPIRALGTRRWT